MFSPIQEDGQASLSGSDKAAEEEGEDLADEEEYDEEEEEDDDDRPRKKPRHGGFILDEAGKTNLDSNNTIAVQNSCQHVLGHQNVLVLMYLKETLLIPLVLFRCG